MLDIFTNSALVTTVFHYFVGLPLQRRGSELTTSGGFGAAEREPIEKVRLSMQLKGARVSIGVKKDSRTR